jgi:flavin-binding protein dodecin
MLAQAERVRDVSAEKLADIAARNGLELNRSLEGQRRDIYRRYLEHCLEDHCLSVEEAADLTHLRGILRLEGDQVTDEHDRTARAIYGKAIDRVLADQRIDPEEKAFLEKLRMDLRLAESVATEMLERGTAQARSTYVAKTASYDGALLSSDSTSIELTGESQTTIEDAINAGLEEASQAVPDLRSVVVKEVSAEVADGRAVRWRVKLKAKLGG